MKGSRIINKMIELNIDGEKVAKNRKQGYSYKPNQKQQDDLPEDPDRIKHDPFYQKLFPPQQAKNIAKQSSNKNWESEELDEPSLEKDTQKKKFFKSTQPSYPMCMTFFEPLNLCIFALVSDIVIYDIQQNGQKK